MPRNYPILRKGVLLDDTAYSRDDRGGELSNLSATYTTIKVNTPIPSDNQPLVNVGQFPVIPFFRGFNDFAELLGLAIEISPVHAACVQSKARYAVGDGFIIKPGSRSLLIDIVRAIKSAAGVGDNDKKRIEDFVSKVNGESDDLQDIAYNCFYDFEGYGQTYIQLIRANIGGKKAFTTWHHQAHTVLLERPNTVTGDIEGVWVSNNWSAGFLSGAFAPERIGLYPHWTPTANGLGETTMLRVKEYSARKIHYGLPRSVAALLWESLEYKIPKFNSDGFDNNFSPSALVQFFGAMTDDGSKKFLNDFHKTFTGDGKNGRIFAQVLPEKSMAANITQFKNDAMQGNYLELDKVTTQKIITAHTWHTALAGIQTPGRLSNSSEIRNAWELAENTVIKYARKKVGKIINLAVYEAMLWLYGQSTAKYYLDFASSMPISFLGDIDINSVLTKNEVREEAGYDVLRDSKGKESELGFTLVHPDTRPIVGAQPPAPQPPIDPNGN